MPRAAAPLRASSRSVRRHFPSESTPEIHMKSDAGRRSRRSPARASGEVDVEWLYGFHSVREALRARRRRLDRLWIRDGRTGRDEAELVGLAGELGVPVERVDRARLAARFGPEEPVQGVALAAGPLPESTIDDLIGASPRSGNEVLVALDGVEDPQNVGAIARVAESAGAAGLILTERRAPGLTPAVSRAGAGAIEWLPVARVGNLTRSLEAAQAAGFWVLAAEPESGEDLYSMPDATLRGRLVIVLGAEGRGVRPGVLKVADHRVRLPMRGHIESLNVSTAGAILLYEILRRQIRAGIPAGTESP